MVFRKQPSSVSFLFVNWLFSGFRMDISIIIFKRGFVTLQKRGGNSFCKYVSLF